MAGSTKKRKSTNSDFKRIKAKVGKKALKPANVTDTSFKAASVSVQNQAVNFSSFSNQKLVSERGRSIQDLVTQLNHPAAAVRMSAIRGLSNVVDSHASESHVLMPHLSVLLPAVAKCSVDEDDDVRQLGLGVLQNILSTTTREHELIMRPFLPLLIAYTTSALNSLDRATRLDGGKAVEILCTTLPSLMSTSNEQAEALLPAFVGLLADYSRQRHRQTDAANKKKRKKAGDSSCGESKRFTILQGLAALLRTTPKPRQQDDSVGGSVVNKGSNKPDLVFVTGGRTTNALLVAGCECRRVKPLQSFAELESFTVGGLEGSDEKDSGLSVAVATDLISKLRDIYIEVSQRGGSEGSRGRLVLGATDVEELSLLNEAIHLFWNAFGRDMMVQQGSEGLRKVFMSLLSLMMESFPVSLQGSTTGGSATKIAFLNAQMSATLMDIGGVLEAECKGLNWTKKVLEYLLPRVNSDASVPIQGDIIVDVLSKLLLLKNDSMEFLLSEKTRCKVLERICEMYFKDVTPDVARLTSSRRAALLIVDLLSNENFVLDNSNSFGVLLRVALKILPFYLQAWRGDFLEESMAVLSALHDVARRLDVEDASSQEILEFIRNAITLVCEAPKQPKRQKRSEASQSPIFELYSEEMQRQTLGLLVMIGSPSEATISGLSYMCARCSSVNAEGAISPVIADAVLYAVHCVRRQMSMQAYLSFVVDSIGIVTFTAKQKAKSGPVGGSDTKSSESDAPPAAADETRESQAVEEVNLDLVKASEAAVARAARSFKLCGNRKVLPMIFPVLNAWLGTMSSYCGLDPLQRAIQFRASLAIISMLVLDMNAGVQDTQSKKSVAFEVSTFVPSILDLFTFCFPRGSSTVESGDALEYMMQPIVVSYSLLSS